MILALGILAFVLAMETTRLSILVRIMRRRIDEQDGIILELVRLHDGPP